MVNVCQVDYSGYFTTAPVVAQHRIEGQRVLSLNGNNDGITAVRHEHEVKYFILS